MYVKAQVYTAKGYYGEPVSFAMRNIAQIGEELIQVLSNLPDELEGEQFIDWTEIKIEVHRENLPSGEKESAPVSVRAGKKR